MCSQVYLLGKIWQEYCTAYTIYNYITKFWILLWCWSWVESKPFSLYMYINLHTLKYNNIDHIITAIIMSTSYNNSIFVLVSRWLGTGWNLLKFLLNESWQRKNALIIIIIISTSFCVLINTNMHNYFCKQIPHSYQYMASFPHLL